ncbi:HAD-IC family P-type ATPase, partial [Mucilaginibacter sp. 5B2]|nr:HAD-IC family P-type ATPase [Mucilaginibacter sp. 5B2]
MEALKTPDSFWQFSKADALKQVSGNENGLDEPEAGKRRKQYGPNTIKADTGSSAILLFLSQFKSPITLMLIAAALLSAGLGDVADTLIILAIVLISSFLGFWQEKGASDAVKELMKMVQLHCDVLRDGKKKEIPVEEVVPGDVVILSAGDVIPGDSLILDSQELFVDEAAFTGETYPVEKNSGVLPADTPLAKRSNALFMGSHVISGKANALIVKTGKQTEFGQISAG